MLRLQKHILCALRAASHATASPLHLSTATAATTPPAQFAVKHYLVASCSLAPAQALKASKRLILRLKSPANLDAVRAFLTEAGIASAIALDPRFLCSKVDKTLSPRVGQHRECGQNPIALYLLNLNIENVVKPNMAFLQQCGLTDDDISGLYLRTDHLLTNNLEHLKKMVARAEKLGVGCPSGMLKTTLITVCNYSPERISAKMESLERAIGCCCRITHTLVL